jgi:hypothetical protein
VGIGHSPQERALDWVAADVIHVIDEVKDVLHNAMCHRHRTVFATIEFEVRIVRQVLGVPRDFCLVPGHIPITKENRGQQAKECQGVGKKRTH